MDIALVYKVIGVGIIVMFSGMVLDKADRKEQSLLVSVSGIIAVLLMLIDKLSELFEKIRFIFSRLKRTVGFYTNRSSFSKEDFK